jgi:TRAP-type mannitol/chloroaromatic compound transport system substrate-binding protein
VNQDIYNTLPKRYQAILSQAAAAASADMIATYDAENPAALRRLVAQGAQIKAFPKAVMEACYLEAVKIYDGLSAKDPTFKKIYEDMVTFRDNEIPWFRIAEGSFDSFMATISRVK